MSSLKQSAQAQRIRNAERQLERLDALREKQIRIIEEENAKMERLIRDSQESAARMGTSSTDPPLTNASPNSFQSQFDQFSATASNERLESVSPEVFREAKEILEPNGSASEPQYSFHDRDMHWETLKEVPDSEVYVSGIYTSFDTQKQYEYKLTQNDIPISVGDVRMAPIHYQGHDDGKTKKGRHTHFRIEDIYTKAKYHGDHDELS